MREGSFVILFQVLTIIYWVVVKGGWLSNQPCSKYTMYHVLNLILTRPFFLVFKCVNVLFIYKQIEWIIFSRYLTSDKGAALKGWQIAVYLKVYQPKRNHTKIMKFKNLFVKIRFKMKLQF